MKDGRLPQGMTQLESGTRSLLCLQSEGEKQVSEWVLTPMMTNKTGLTPACQTAPVSVCIYPTTGYLTLASQKGFRVKTIFTVFYLTSKAKLLSVSRTSTYLLYIQGFVFLIPTCCFIEIYKLFVIAGFLNLYLYIGIEW